jgi:hypothetical protein
MVVFSYSEAGFGDATEKRCPPNTARTKHVPLTLDPAPFGDATRDVLKAENRWHKRVRLSKSISHLVATPSHSDKLSGAVTKSKTKMQKIGVTSGPKIGPGSELSTC